MTYIYSSLICFFVYFSCGACEASVQLGIDVFFSEGVADTLRGKRVGLITNQTGVNRSLSLTYDLFLQNTNGFRLAALFSPEHGFFGQEPAAASCKDHKVGGNIPVFSLYGKTQKPTAEMLQNIDVLVYDIQDVGSRPYTYSATLYGAMEEAAKAGIEVIVLDRPNPLGGDLVDGPMVDEGIHSLVSYIDVPYCHGMTIGELARYYNGEYGVCCKLTVVSMKGWKRSMSFKDTGLSWIPTSPHIPEPDTPFFYAITGLIGELNLVNIGVGYTLPFKIVGAPWLQAKELAKSLNRQKLPGVFFTPFYFKPLYGLYKGESCQGVLINILDPLIYRPIRTQHFILGVIKAMYPKEVEVRMAELPQKNKKWFCNAAGGDQILSVFLKERYPAWKMVQYQSEKGELFLKKRKKYLLYN